MLSPKSSKSAYSLIELIISISILSLIILFSIPSFTALLTTLEAHRCLNQLQATLGFAKYLAQLNQQAIQIDFKPTRDLRLTDLEIYDPNTKKIINQNPSLFKLKYGYIQFNHPNLKHFPLTFYPAGHTNQPGTFSYYPKLSQRQHVPKQQLILSRTGQSRKTV